MQEEFITSGRNIPHIDPTLNVWHISIPVYLFLGGLAAGILFFAALYSILKKENELPTAVKWSTFLVPFILVIGLFALFIDLKNQWNFWRLYTTFRIESPMSWGAWVLMAITPLSFIWAASYLKELIPGWNWKLDFIEKAEEWVIKHRRKFAWVIICLAVLLGIYTGILLSAFNARPLWNTAILGPLFLVSGLSTGAAVIMWMSKNHKEQHLFGRIDLLLICIELFLITHLFMGFLSGPEVQLDAAQLFLTGKFALPFWIGVVAIGLVFPMILEIVRMRGSKISAGWPAMLILIGGFLLRFLIVEGGELTGYIY
jgi:formate-dependent nitrite reductase membrane component NrfD